MSDRCLDAQLLAAFAERKLKRSEMPEVLAHLERCPNCMSSLRAAMDLMEPRKESRRWLPIAAAIAVVLGAAPFVYRFVRSTETDELVRLAPRSARVVEARLSGGFAWAPYRAPMRSTDEKSESQRMKLVGAAGELVERADNQKTAAAQHAAGIGLVLVEKPEDAIPRLRAATEHSPADAHAWSDLAAAEYMTALRLGRASLYPVALAHADRALRIDPNLAEALFNRALILERLGLTQVAREAWNVYLRTDASSQWANEARDHLKRLPVSTGQSQFKREQPQLESAASRGDQPTVDAIVDRYRQQSRTWAEAEYLGRWAEAERNGNRDEATRALAVARGIGDALVRLSGESLLHDAVAAIDHASLPTRTSIAEAHVTYRRGRIAYSRRQPAAAEPDLRHAAALFANANDPMSLVARYFAACTRFDQSDVATARSELESLRDPPGTAGVPPAGLGRNELESSITRDRGRDARGPRGGYAALGAQIRWELTLCAITDEDWSAAAALSTEAEETFRQLGEKSNLAFMQAILSTALISLGRPDEGWVLRAKAFENESGEGRGDRLPTSVGDAARVELRNGGLDAARALLNLEETAYRAASDNVELSNSLVRTSLIEAQLGNDGDASRCVRDAMTTAQRITDPALRAHAIADANFAGGVAAFAADPAASGRLLSQALAHYRTSGHWFYLPEALLWRARASLRLGDPVAAVRDLEDGIDEVEHRRSAIAGQVLGSGVLDARRALFDAIVPLRLDRGDVAGAFADADRARTRLATAGDAKDSSVAALQQKLAGSDTAILEVIVLPRELVAFCVTSDNVAVSRHPIAQSAVAALAARDDEEASRALYDLIIRPAERSLARTRQLIVVADTALQQVSFAALADKATERHLIERMTVALAPSASALEAARPQAPQSVLAMALPSGEEARTAALPEGRAELADVVKLYKHAVEIEADRASLSAIADAARTANVIHISGHTARQAGGGDAALLFRGHGTATEPVTWSRIASMKLAAPVVVLAACETLRAPASPQAHALSLGGGFLAAGAASVIGTLTPVADNEARDLFRAVHRQLSQGKSAAAAVQQAQIEAIAAHAPGWQAIAVLTNRIEPRG